MNYPDELDQIIQAITQRIEASRLSLCKEIYRMLAQEYDYLVSDNWKIFLKKVLTTPFACGKT